MMPPRVVAEGPEAPAARPAAATPDLATLTVMLGQDAVNLRDLMTRIIRRWTWLEEIGLAGLQGDPWNMDQATAEALFEQFAWLAAPALFYFGRDVEPGPVDYDAALTLTRGPV